MKILHLCQIYMKIKDIRMRFVKDLLLFFFSLYGILDPRALLFAHDGAKGLGSRMALPQTHSRPHSPLPNGTRKICSAGGGLFASTFAVNGITNLWNQLSVFNQSACNIACDSM